MDGRFLRAVDDRYDKWLFFGAFLSGAIGIIALKLLAIPPLLVAALPIAILLLYAMYLLSTARLSLSLDRAGDNLYYLGLLFTLVSLSYSLVLFVAGSAASDILHDLIGSFGIALFSTIAGMLLRVFVQQYRNDPVDIERQARGDLADAVRELRHSLLGAVADINTLRRATTQSMAELSNDVANTLTKAADSTTVAIADTGKSLKRVVEQVEKGFTEHSEQLSAATNQAARSATSLSTSIDGLHAGSSTLLKDLSDRSTAERGATQDLRALATTLRETTFTELSSSVTQTSQTLRAIVAETKAIAESLHAINEDLSTSSRKAATSIESHLKSMRELLEALERQAESSRSMTSELQDALIEVARAIRTEISRA